MHSFFCLKHSIIIILLNYLKLWGDSGCRSCWPLSYSKQILPSAVYVILHLMLSLVILPSTGGSMIVWQTIAIFIITRTNLLDWKEKYSLSHVQTCWTEKRNIHHHMYKLVGLNREIFIIKCMNLLDWTEKFSLSHVWTCWTEQRNIHYHMYELVGLKREIFIITCMNLLDWKEKYSL